MLGSKSARWTWRRAVLYGFLSGCFITLVSIAGAGIFVLCGLVSLDLTSRTIYWALAVFGVSSITITLAVIAFEAFCEP